MKGKRKGAAKWPCSLAQFSRRCEACPEGARGQAEGPLLRVEAHLGEQQKERGGGRGVMVAGMGVKQGLQNKAKAQMHHARGRRQCCLPCSLVHVKKRKKAVTCLCVGKKPLTQCSSPTLSTVLLSALSVARGQLQPKNITWKIPEINNS